MVAYALLDLRRRGLTVKRLVWLLEQSVIDLLAAHGVPGARRPGAPGVYVDGAKVAALGLRVRGGCAITASRSTSTWTSRPSATSTPAATQGSR